MAAQLICRRLIDCSVNESVNELMTNVFVEQPLALPGSANHKGPLYLSNVEKKTSLLHRVQAQTLSDTKSTTLVKLL